MMLLGYVGPEVMLPAASILATILGIFVAFGRAIVSFFKRCLGFAPKTEVKAEEQTPEVLSHTREARSPEGAAVPASVPPTGV